MFISFTPTPIVNKNGVATTVHKKQQSASPAASRLAGIAPTISASATAATGQTPLPALEPMTMEEWRVWGSQHPTLTQRVDYARTTPIESLVNHADAEMRGLARRVVEGGVDPEMAAYIINRFAERVEVRWRRPGGKERALVHLEATLLVAESVDMSVSSPYNDPTKKSMLICGAVETLNYSDNPEDRVPLERFTTREQVASAAAVAGYILSNEGSNIIGKRTYLDATKMDMSGWSINNKLMDSFLRERPDQLDRILKYRADHYADNRLTSNKEVKRMIAFMVETEDYPALADGWL
jgi:hypothetical protein